MSISSTESLHSIGATATNFAEEFLEPITADLDRSGKFPRPILAELARQQLLALPTVEHCGFIAHVETLRMLSQACPAVASILNQHALVAYAVFKWGKPAQQARYLPGLVEGQSLGALAIAEGGRDAFTAMIGGGKITLNRKKEFVRNAGVADVYLGFTSAGTDVIGFIASGQTEGLSADTQDRTMGLRGCPVADLIFSDVVPDEADLLGTLQNGSLIRAALTAARVLGEAAQSVGIGRIAASHAAAAARRRVQFGHPSADLQAIQQLLGEIATDSHLAWLGVLHAAQLIDEGAPFALEAGMVQSFEGRFAQKILMDAIQVEGGGWDIRGHPAAFRRHAAAGAAVSGHGRDHITGCARGFSRSHHRRIALNQTASTLAELRYRRACLHRP
jgi:butyryl-CoA dehydrogenase